MAAYETERDDQCLAAAGLPVDEARSFLREAPAAAATDFSGDRTRFSDYWAKSARLRGRLPAKPRRSAREQAAASLIAERARDARMGFLRRHGDAVYDALTVRRSRFVRVEELALRAGALVPGLVPTARSASSSTRTKRERCTVSAS